jgi:hypothetical protein
MIPDIDCLIYLSQNSFIRNFPFEKFLEKNNNNIQLQNFICYTTGVADGKRIVHAFRFIAQSSNSKIKSYLIEWWNTAIHSVYFPHTEFTSIQFWVHSGMTLRKNFFLYQDRLSLFRSTFIHDLRSGNYYRLSYLNHFISIPEINNYQAQIFSQPGKYYYQLKQRTKMISEYKSPVEKEIKKLLEKIIKKKNLALYLKKSSSVLFQEIQKFVV